MTLTTTDLSNFDKWWSDVHFVSFLFHYYCIRDPIIHENMVHTVQGVSKLESKLALTDSKMKVRFCSNVVLKFWDYRNFWHYLQPAFMKSTHPSIAVFQVCSKQYWFELLLTADINTKRGHMFLSWSFYLTYVLPCLLETEN